MAKHTPGPWGTWSESDGRGESVLVGIVGSRPIARILKSFGSSHANADAKLIAAAPDLLTALKALLPEGWGDDDTMDHMPGVKLARLAIAKAEGK